MGVALYACSVAITPEALREVDFRQATLRGYHPDDVDAFLERLAAGIEVLQQRLREATERAVRAERSAIRHDQIESDKAMRRLLAESQAEADKVLAAARALAARTVASANAYAEALQREAIQAVERTSTMATTEVAGDVCRLEGSRDHIRAELLAFERAVVSDALPRQGHPTWPPCLHAVEQQLPGVTVD